MNFQKIGCVVKFRKEMGKYIQEVRSIVFESYSLSFSKYDFLIGPTFGITMDYQKIHFKSGFKSGTYPGFKREWQ